MNCLPVHFCQSYFWANRYAFITCGVYCQPLQGGSGRSYVSIRLKMFWKFKCFLQKIKKNAQKDSFTAREYSYFNPTERSHILLKLFPNGRQWTSGWNFGREVEIHKFKSLLAGYWIIGVMTIMTIWSIGSEAEQIALIVEGIVTSQCKPEKVVWRAAPSRSSV